MKNKYNKNSKKKTAAKNEHFTNLMLITVAEAMILLILQLGISNLWAVPALAGGMWSVMMPVVFWLAVIASIVILIAVYAKNKKGLLAILSFTVYLALLMAIMRYIPNTYSEAVGGYIVNSLRGQKIGVITSVVYIAAKFSFYSVMSKKVK